MGLSQSEKDIFDALVGGEEVDALRMIEGTLNGDRVPVIVAVTVLDDEGVVLAPLAVLCTEAPVFDTLRPEDDDFDIVPKELTAEREAKAREAA